MVSVIGIADPRYSRAIAVPYDWVCDYSYNIRIIASSRRSRSRTRGIGVATIIIVDLADTAQALLLARLHLSHGERPLRVPWDPPIVRYSRRAIVKQSDANRSQISPRPGELLHPAKRPANARERVAVIKVAARRDVPPFREL